LHRDELAEGSFGQALTHARGPRLESETASRAAICARPWAEFEITEAPAASQSTELIRRAAGGVEVDPSSLEIGTAGDRHEILNG
jgi:hypothetical protein